MIDAIGKEAVIVSLAPRDRSFGNKLTQGTRSFRWNVLKKLRRCKTINDFIIKGHATSPPPVRKGLPPKAHHKDL